MKTIQTSEAKKRLIVVLGMHRSGTSAITRALNVLGVELGDRLMPAIEGNNAKGFFEDIDINELNIEILKAIDSRWDNLAEIEPSDIESLRRTDFFLRAVELLRRKTSKYPVFGIKDPRMAKLVPFWQLVFAHCKFDVAYVLAIRNPLSVAESLKKRDDFCHDKSYLLWLSHTLSSLVQTESHTRVIVDYDQFMDASQTSLAQIAKQFSLTVNKAAFEEFHSEFLSESLRHNIYTIDDLVLDHACLPLVKDVYTELFSIVQGSKKLNQSEFQKLVKAWVDEFERFTSCLNWIDHLSTELGTLSQSFSKPDAETTDLIKSVIEQEPGAFQRTFNGKWYLQHHTDLTNSGVDPYEHYIHFGVNEGRLPAANITSFALKTLLERASERNEISQFTEARLSELNENKKNLSEQLLMGQEKLQCIEQERTQREREIAGQVVAFQQQVNVEKTELSQQHQAQLQEIQRQYMERELLGAERIQTVNHEVQRLQTENATREKAHTAALAALQNELVAQLRVQAQREQEIAGQFAAFQQQANSEKNELNQQHQTLFQERQRQQLERERLTAERIHTLDQKLQRLQAENAARERTHSDALLTVQNECAFQLRQQAQREKKLEEQYAEFQQKADTEIAELRQQHQACLQEIQSQQADIELLEQTHAEALTYLQNEHVAQINISNEHKQHIAEQIELANERKRVLEANRVALQRVQSELTTIHNVLLHAPFSNSTISTEKSSNLAPVISVSLEELLGCHDEQFIHKAYHTLLGRSPDPDGLRYYLGHLRQGVSKLEILSQIRFSKEGVAREHGVEGLERVIVQHRRHSRSLQARMARLFGLQKGKPMQDLLAMENQYHRLDARGHELVSQIERSLSRLREVIQNNAFEQELQIAETSNAETIHSVASTSPESEAVKATVAILTKNPGDIFKKVLVSVLDQEAPWPYEVLVVDSGSSDGTIEFIERYPKVRLVRIKSSDFGHGHTRNFAMSLAKGQYVAMLTHDAMPLNKSWLENLVKPLDADSSVAGVFGRHKAYEEHSAYTKRDIELHFNGFLQWPLIMGIEDLERYTREQGYRQVLHFFSDNNACLRKDVWEKIPYPDVDFAEDQLWAKAVIEAGYKRGYADDAVVYHSHDYSTWDTFRRSFDESRAFKTLFDYDLCPTARHGLTQIRACTGADLNYMVSTGVRKSFGLTVNTLFLHIAKQTGWYIGRYSGRFKDTIFWLFSLDDAKKRKGQQYVVRKTKDFI
jgi:rhamnosyltransferase